MAKRRSLDVLRIELSEKEAELGKAKQKLEQVEHKMNRLQNKIKTESKKQRDARTHALCFKAGHLEYVFPVINGEFVGDLSRASTACPQSVLWDMIMIKMEIWW